MNILALWREQLTAKSLKTIGSRWWQTSETFFRIMLRDWWPLVIMVMTGYAWFFNYFIEQLKPIINNLEKSGDFSPLLALILLSPIIIILGFWSAALLLVAHPSEKAKGKIYYRSHWLFFILVALLAGIAFGLRLMALGEHTVYVPISLIVKELFYIFSSFFILSARPSIINYLRAVLILPFKVAVLNLPQILVLFLLLIPLNLLPSGLSVFLVCFFAPLFLVLCGVVYKLAIEKNREAF